MVPLGYDNESNPSDSIRNIFLRHVCHEISMNSSMNRIQSILDGNPDWLTCYGMLRPAVEHAIIAGASSPVVKLLIEHNCKCVQILKHPGPPLLLYVAILCNAPFDIIELLLLLSPSDKIVRDDNEKSHLHHACSCATISLDVIKLLLTKNPNSIWYRDSSESFPLHVACRSNVSPDVVRFLLEQDCKVVCEPNKFGMRPIHHACFSGACLDTVKLLVEHFHDSV